MSNHIHSGLHPDTDLLAAFTEGVLSEPERADCLAHLANCQRCREILFLAIEPEPTSAPAPARRWRFALLPAAAVCLILLAVGYFIGTNNTVGPPPRVLHHLDIPPGAPVVVQSVPPALPAPPPIHVQTGTIPQFPLSLPPSIPAPPEALAGISGTVTDITGAGLFSASISLRQIGGTYTSTGRTDSTGQFQLTRLPPGRYELQVTAPGFRDSSRQVDVRPGEMAAVKSELAVGAVAETVEVTAEAAPAPAIPLVSGLSGVVVDSSGAVVPGATVHLRPVAGVQATDSRSGPAGEFTFSGLQAGGYELRIEMRGFRTTVTPVELHAGETAKVRPELKVGDVTEAVEITAGPGKIYTSTAAVAKVRPVHPLPSKLPIAGSATSGKNILAIDSAGAVFLSRDS